MLTAFLNTRPFSSLLRPLYIYSQALSTLDSSTLLPAMATSSGSGASDSRRANRLASEHSPYLLQHAYNPVEWYPWGDEAFVKARERDVPIFLSIGYSTCHWCHVMEVQSFESEEIAKMLNEWFVSIKVDREERPDVDKVYMTFIQALYGSGGWPLSVFLTPKLKPIMGGTYFPPDDNYGRPGFRTILRKVKETWETKREVLEKSGSLAIEQLKAALSMSANLRGLSDDVFGNSVKRCFQQLSSGYDSKYGGFSSAPKFPRPVEYILMLYRSKQLLEIGMEIEAKRTLQMVSHSLTCMGRGGIHDHIGGGFHRYSVDECWHVPHFEKMLYDQGQLVNAYLDTFSITSDTLCASFARDILDYLRRDMIGKEGEIYSAEDADSAEYLGAPIKKEGAFYVWKSTEIQEVLGDSSDVFMAHYYVKPSGNCDLSKISDPHHEFVGKNVLIERQDSPSLALKFNVPLEKYCQLLGESRRLLFDVRSKRPRPHLDDKVIVAWNGLAISSLARASKILKSERKGTDFYFPVTGCDPSEYLEVAEKAASFLKTNLYDASSHRLCHSFCNGPSKAPGFLDDYAFLISALLDLFEFSGKTNYLIWAMELQATQDELFLDQEGGGYFNTPGQDPSVLLRVKEDYDGAEPSGNSVSAINLIRLSSMVAAEKSEYYRRNAEHLLLVFESRLKEQSMAVPLMCCAADMIAFTPRRQVILVGNKSSPEFEEMIVAAHTSYDPNRTVIQIDPSSEVDMEFWEENNPNLSLLAKKSPKGEVVAHVCLDFACAAPTRDRAALLAMLSKQPTISTSA